MNLKALEILQRALDKPQRLTLHVEDLVSEEAVTAIESDSSLVPETVDLTSASPESEAVSLVEMGIEPGIDAIVESCKSSRYSENPVQEKLITGRLLEILDPTSCEKVTQTLLWWIVRTFWRQGLKKF